jgi:hypothetical protein
MDQECFCVVWTVGIFQSDRFGGLSRTRARLSELATRIRERGLGDAIDDHFRANGVVVAGVADVQIRRIRLWARAGGDVFPVAILGSVHAKSAE